jgi:branched-chain amino acid transport system substrate-binding protein
MVQAVQAWASAINKQGGLNCQPVRYIVADDGGDPSRHQALVQQLVEQDHIIAFVMMAAPIAGQASVNYIDAHRIPVIGTEGASQWFNENPMYFPQDTAANKQIEVMFATAARSVPGKTRVAAISCVEAPICSGSYGVAPAYAAKYHLNLVYRGQVSVGQPDYTATCQAMSNAGADIMILALDANSIVRLIRSCHSVNYSRPIVTASISVPGPQTGDAAFDGMFLEAVIRPYFDTSNPAVAEFRNTLAQYAPGLERDLNSETGWVGAKLFALAARNISGPATSQSLLDGLWSIKNNDLNGLTAPLSFSKDQNAATPLCFWLMQLHPAGASSPDGFQRTCE